MISLSTLSALSFFFLSLPFNSTTLDFWHSCCNKSHWLLRLSFLWTVCFYLCCWNWVNVYCLIFQPLTLCCVRSWCECWLLNILLIVVLFGFWIVCVASSHCLFPWWNFWCFYLLQVCLLLHVETPPVHHSALKSVSLSACHLSVSICW